MQQLQKTISIEKELNIYQKVQQLWFKINLINFIDTY